MKNITIILFFLSQIVFGISVSLHAQTDTSWASDEILLNGKRYKAIDEKKTGIAASKKKQKLPDSIFIIDNKKFQYYNNWLTGGAGWQQNLTYKRELGFAGGIDFNFHFKHNYFQSGVMVSGLRLSSYNNYQLHLGYGKRFEDKDYQFSAFIGASYSIGTQVTQIDSIKYVRKNYSQPGIYLQGEIVKKITYDVGAGFSMFADWNKEQSMIGLRIILYFSGAYIGKKNKTYEDYQ